jgi:hypothetical protein
MAEFYFHGSVSQSGWWGRSHLLLMTSFLHAPCRG